MARLPRHTDKDPSWEPGDSPDGGLGPDDESNREADKPWDGRAGAGRPGTHGGGRQNRHGGGRGHDRGADRGRQRGRHEQREAAFEEDGCVWIWGLHAAKAAFENPRRSRREVLVTRNAAHRLGLDPDQLPGGVKACEPKDIDRRLPDGAVHQGLAVLVSPLEPMDLADAVMRPERPVVILDQVTDPQNVGAILRSAAAFGIAAVILQTRNAPALGGALAKAAAGAVESLEEVRVVNISRAIDAFRDAGWRVVGLDGEASADLATGFAGYGPLAIVLGAEGSGLRPGVASACSALARIPMAPGAESLNVSNAAAIAFYEAARITGAAHAAGGAGASRPGKTD